jgi:anti-anti-sigma regulatory factor
MLQLTVEDRSLVGRADWADVLARSGPPLVLVALDLGAVDFISSLFLESCMEFRRLLAERGQDFVLMNLSPEHLRVLDAAGGAGRLPVLRSDAELDARLSALATDEPHDGCDGVSAIEKNALWS